MLILLLPSSATPAAKEINTITADDLQRFVSGEGKQVLGVGALSIGQLRQTMNAASMDTMQVQTRCIVSFFAMDPSARARRAPGMASHKP